MSKDQLPTVTSQIPNDLRMFLNRVREVLSGASTDPLVRQSELTSTVTAAVSAATDDSAGIPIFAPEDPAGLTALAGFDFITLTWTAPVYYGHATTEVWRSVNNNLGNALLIATLEGRVSVFSDYVGTNTTYYYWIRYKNLSDVFGAYAGPVSATTAYDVVELLDELTDQISQGQLADDLNNLTNGINDKHLVTINADGLATGYGLASTTNDSGTLITQFGIAANQMFVMSPSDYNQPVQPTGATEGELWRHSVTGDYFVYTNGAWEPFEGLPFIVQTTPTVVDGVEVPPGVYLRDAFIADASIANAKLGVASVDFANIVDAAITTGKVTNLDAAKIQSGELQSYNFNNTATTPGFYLKLGQSESVDAEGNVTYTAEDVQLIIRSAGSVTPALQLLNGVVSINAANINNVLQSTGYGTSTSGFQFDVDNGSFIVRGTGGTILLSAGGYDGTLVQSSIQTTLTALGNKAQQGVDDANTAQNDANAAQTTATAAQGTATAAQGTATAAQGAANAAQGTANAAQGTATAAQGAANAAQTTANTASANASAALSELDTIFDVDAANGGYKFTASSYTNFFSNDNTLKAFAFLERVTSQAQFDTLFDNAVIGRAAIGAAAIGAAQIEDGVISNAKIGALAVKEANMDTASVTTLKIGGNAVTVPLGAGGFLNFDSTTAYQNLGSQVTTGVYTFGTGPTALNVTARAQFGGGPSGGGNASEGTAVIRVKVEFFKYDTLVWELSSVSLNISEANFSFQAGYGGSVNTSFTLDVPWWTTNIRAQLQGKTVSPPSGGGNPSRELGTYNISVLAAKR